MINRRSSWNSSDGGWQKRIVLSALDTRFSWHVIRIRDIHDTQSVEPFGRYLEILQRGKLFLSHFDWHSIRAALPQGVKDSEVSTHPQFVSFSNVSDGIKIENVVLDEHADQRSNFSWKHFLDIATTL
jgi:hypothetical protein